MAEYVSIPVIIHFVVHYPVLQKLKTMRRKISVPVKNGVNYVGTIAYRLARARMGLL